MSHGMRARNAHAEPGRLRSDRPARYTCAAWPSGGIGRRSRLKIDRRKASRFESGEGHSPKAFMSTPGMASRKALRAALLALDALAANQPLRGAVSRALESEPGLGPKERRFVSVSARQVAQLLRRLDAFVSQGELELRKLIPQDRSLVRLLALRLRVHGAPDGQVLRELALPGPRRPRSVSDANLVRLAAKMPRELALPAEAQARRALWHAYPDWLLARLAAAVPEGELDAWLDATAEPPELFLRVNLLRATPESVLEELRAAGLSVRPGRYLPEALICEDRALLFDTGAFKGGRVAVQDEASQLIARLCGAGPGLRVLDYCAGAGGKALALAGQGAAVSAADAIASRLQPLRERAKRAGATIELLAPDELPARAFDVVLVDAPCSGLGALSREPDSKWRLSRESLDAFPVKQLEILAKASEAVKPGGRLVYATCSPLPEEDERVVERFLEGRPEFSLEPPASTLGEPLAARLGAERTMHLWAHRHGTGSFFAVSLHRAASP